MAMMIQSDDDNEVIGTINTTPLVDIMLVLLIIFIITVPTVVHTVNVKLPIEKNTPYANKPENIQLAVNKKGEIFWNENYVPSTSVLLARLQQEAQKRPQPEVHIRGDQITKFEAIDQVINTTKQAGIGKIAFVTTPPASP